MTSLFILDLGIDSWLNGSTGFVAWLLTYILILAVIVEGVEIGDLMEDLFEDASGFEIMIIGFIIHTVMAFGTMMLMVFASNNEQYWDVKWCRRQDSNLRTVTDWDLIPAPLTKLGDSCSDLNGITGVYQHIQSKYTNYPSEWFAWLVICWHSTTHAQP